MSALLRIASLSGTEALTTAQLLVFVLLLAALVAGYCIGRAQRTGDQ